LKSSNSIKDEKHITDHEDLGLILECILLITFVLVYVCKSSVTPAVGKYYFLNAWRQADVYIECHKLSLNFFSSSTESLLRKSSFKVIYLSGYARWCFNNYSPIPKLLSLVA